MYVDIKVDFDEQEVNEDLLDKVQHLHPEEEEADNDETDDPLYGQQLFDSIVEEEETSVKNKRSRRQRQAVKLEVDPLTAGEDEKTDIAEGKVHCLNLNYQTV